MRRAWSGRAPAARCLPHGTSPPTYTPPLCTPSPTPAVPGATPCGDARVDVAKVAGKIGKTAGKVAKVAKVAIHDLHTRERKRSHAK